MIPPEVLASVDRLNSHARAHGCGKKAIYAYKLLVVLMLAEAGELQARPVATMSKCHRCNGTGRFHWDGEDTGERCRTCGAKGYVHLRFAETKFGPSVWHHPWERGGYDIMRAAWKVAQFDYRHGLEVATLKDGTTREVMYESAGDWTPNRGGERLRGEPAAKELNVVERWVEAVPGTLGWATLQALRWPIERAQRSKSEYALELGRIGINCYLCGKDVHCGQGHMKPLLHWSRSVCVEHFRLPVDQWPQEPPDSAITPEVEVWLNRRGWTRGQPFKVGRAA